MQYDKWTNKLEKRFDILLSKKYENKATESELDEFEELRKARQQLKAPKIKEEIIAEQNREQAINKLIKSIETFKPYII